MQCTLFGSKMFKTDLPQTSPFTIPASQLKHCHRTQGLGTSTVLLRIKNDVEPRQFTPKTVSLQVREDWGLSVSHVLHLRHSTCVITGCLWVFMKQTCCPIVNSCRKQQNKNALHLHPIFRNPAAPLRPLNKVAHSMTPPKRSFLKTE